MESEIHSQIIEVDQHRHKKGKQRPKVQLSLTYTLLLFWLLIFSLLLGYLAISPAIRSKASSLNPALPTGTKGAIPGLTYKHLTKYLRGTNMTCQPAIQTETSFAGACSGISPQGIVDIQVQVFGKSPNEIDTLQMDMVQNIRTPSKELFIDALGEVAALPFTGSKPNSARLWVKKSLDLDEAAETFGGVPYQLFSYGPSMKRMLIGISR